MSGVSILEISIIIFLLVGALFTLVGSIGLLRLDDPIKRLHAPTKAGTMGIGALLFASMLYSYLTGEGSFHELLVMLFLFVTAPVSAHFIAKVHILRTRGAGLPESDRDHGWATLDEPADDKWIEPDSPTRH